MASSPHHYQLSSNRGEEEDSEEDQVPSEFFPSQPDLLSDSLPLSDTIDEDADEPPSELLFEAPSAIKSSREDTLLNRSSTDSNRPHASHGNEAALSSILAPSLPFGNRHSPDKGKSTLGIIPNSSSQVHPPLPQPTRQSVSPLSLLDDPKKSLSAEQHLGDKRLIYPPDFSSRLSPLMDPAQQASYGSQSSKKGSSHMEIGSFRASYDHPPSLPFSTSLPFARQSTQSSYTPPNFITQLNTASEYQPPNLEDEDEEGQEHPEAYIGTDQTATDYEDPSHADPSQAFLEIDDEDKAQSEDDDEVPASLRFELQANPESGRQKFPTGFSDDPNTMESGGLLSAVTGSRIGNFIPQRWTRGGSASFHSSPNKLRYAPLPSHHTRSPSSTFSSRARFFTVDSGLDHVQGGIDKGPYNSPSSYSHSRVQSWKDVKDYDRFLTTLYSYYTGKGFFCILHSQVSKLGIILFIMGFTTFLTSCIDYSLIHSKKVLSEVLYPDCYSKMGYLQKLLIMLFSVWWIWNLIRAYMQIPQLRDIQLFYRNILGISDDDIYTVSWPEVTSRIIQTHEATFSSGEHRSHGQVLPHKNLDPHLIANRILRRDNYLIALFNRDLFNLRLPWQSSKSNSTQCLSQVLEWGLSYTLLSFVFDEKGHVKRRFLKASNRGRLTLGLKIRFITVGALALVFAPFLFFFLILYFVFRYTQEYHKNPSSLGTRQYSPIARWKLREFNELPHLFNQRLNRSYKKAVEYLNQFPQEHIIIYAKVISFVTGSFAAVLLIATILNQDLLHDFEITPGYSSFFYITVFGGIAAGASGLVPHEAEVYDPEKVGRELADETHYFPPDWHGKMHTNKVRAEFSQIFENKIVLYLYELFSVLTAPYILMVSLPQSAGQIVDFFREFTVHVDSLGYVCSFAVFDFKRHGNQAYGAPTDQKDDHLASKAGKMESSFLSFKAAYPNWDPGMERSTYLTTVMSRGRNVSNASGEALGSNIAMHPLGESALAASEWSNHDRNSMGKRLGTDLFRLLDAVYESKRHQPGSVF